MIKVQEKHRVSLKKKENLERNNIYLATII